MPITSCMDLVPQFTSLNTARVPTTRNIPSLQGTGVQVGEGSAGAGGSDSVADAAEAAVHCAVQAETVQPESVAGGSSVGAEEGSGQVAAVVSHL